MAGEMIERVARAIYATCNHWDYDGNLPEYDQISDGTKAQWQDAARAAIKAMREPTEAMTEAVYDQADPGFCDEPSIPTTPGDTWCIMIDEALK